MWLQRDDASSGDDYNANKVDADDDGGDDDDADSDGDGYDAADDDGEHDHDHGGVDEDVEPSMSSRELLLLSLASTVGIYFISACSHSNSIHMRDLLRFFGCLMINRCYWPVLSKHGSSRCQSKPYPQT